MCFGKLSPFLSFNSLVLVVLHHVLHAPQLRVQVGSLPQDVLQLSPEVVDVLLEQRLQVLPHSLGSLLLQQGPLGVQDLVLLLQEPHLEDGNMVICQTQEGRKTWELLGLLTGFSGHHGAVLPRACRDAQLTAGLFLKLGSFSARRSP